MNHFILVHFDRVAGRRAIMKALIYLSGNPAILAIAMIVADPFS